MDALYAKIRQDTCKFDLGDEELFEPLYPEPAPSVVRVRDERYGPAERNRLDVYYDTASPAAAADGQKPVVVFVHGGGFFSGDKAWSEKCWANVGTSFAQHGMVAVLVNHQMVPHVRYPGGADDMQLARAWVYRNIAAPRFGGGAPDRVFLLGHSSGGAHIAANLYAAGDPSRAAAAAAANAPSGLFPPVAGVLYLSVPFWYDRTKPMRKKIIGQYYGSDAEDVWGPKSALGLFERLPDDSPLLDTDKVPVFIGTVKWEVKETIEANVAFFNAYRRRSQPAGTLPLFHVLDRHNHLSSVLSIGTADTAQIDVLLQFIASCLARKTSVVKARI